MAESGGQALSLKELFNLPPALLDQTIQSALADDGVEDGVKIFSPDIRVNAGLWICSIYDFKGLGKMYLQMGADIEYGHALDQTPLHIAAANSSAGMLRLLLDVGADPDRTDVDGMNTLHHCCIGGLSEAVPFWLSGESHSTPLDVVAHVERPVLVAWVGHH